MKKDSGSGHEIHGEEPGTQSHCPPAAVYSLPGMSCSKAHSLWAIDMAHRTPQSHIAGPCGLLEMVPARAVPGSIRHLEDRLAGIQVRRVMRIQPLRPDVRPLTGTSN